MDGFSADTALALLSALSAGAVAFREHKMRKRLLATVEEREAHAVAEATSALNRTVETVQAMAKEALEEAKKARTSEIACRARLDALASEFNAFRSEVLSGTGRFRRP